MRRSVVYFSFVSVVISAAVMLVAAASLCTPGQNCLFLPQVSNVPQPMPTSTSTSTPRATATATVAPNATPSATATSNPPFNATPTPTTAPQGLITGLAILGDSTQDEYQADNPRGGAYAATTLNWVEQLQRYRGLNLGPLGTRSEPRRSGFEYNWGRSGATSADMVSNGQHTGAAEQIRAGDVSHGAIQIGINDFYFSGLGSEIYDGEITGDALTAKLNEIIANIELAARTVRDAQPRGVLLASMQDYLTLPIIPEVQAQYSDPVRRQRVIEAFTYLNDRLRAFATREGIHFFDYNTAMLAEINSRRDNQGFLVVGGERIDLNRRGNEPHFGLLDDQYVHPGTVISGLTANVYIRAFNTAFGTTIAPFTDTEILRAAGIVP